MAQEDETMTLERARVAHEAVCKRGEHKAKVTKLLAAPEDGQGG